MKVLFAFGFLVVGVALGLWLALGAQAPQGIGQSWAHVKVEAQQLWGNAQLRISEAQSPGGQGVSGPGLLDRIMTPFKAFGSGVQHLWLNMDINIRPPSP